MPHIFFPELAYELWDFYFARRISVVQGKYDVNQQSSANDWKNDSWSCVLNRRFPFVEG